QCGARLGDYGVANRLAGGLHRAARDVRLARRGRRAGRADIRIGVEHDDVVHAKLGARDLGLHGDQALADLGRGGVHLYARLSVFREQADPGGRVVLEAFGVADVLEPDGVADAAL